MKIMIDDDYYIDENGNKYFSDNISKENYEKQNMMQQSNITIDTNQAYKADEEEATIIQRNDIDVKDEVNSFNNIENDSQIQSGDYSSFSTIDAKEDEYSYYGYNCNYEADTKGTIVVHSKLGVKDGVELKGAKINLYILNGVSPKLFSSKVTNEEGKVVFDNLDDGCYRVIAIVDRRYFEKPSYITWNEVTIDSCCKEASIIVVNKIKESCLKR